MRTAHAFLPQLLDAGRRVPTLRVNAVDPGYTATDFNGNTGPQTLREGTDQMMVMAALAADVSTGTFTDRHGPVCW